VLIRGAFKKFVDRHCETFPLLKP